MSVLSRESEFWKANEDVSSASNEEKGEDKGRSRLTRRKLSPDGLSQQQTDTSTSLLVKGDLKSLSDGILSRVVETSEEESETLLVSGRVRLSKGLDDGGVGEPEEQGGDQHELDE